LIQLTEATSFFGKSQHFDGLTTKA